MTADRRVLVFYPHNYVHLSSGTHARFHELARYFGDRGIAVDLISLDGFTDHWDARSLAAAKHFFQSVTVVEYRETWVRKAWRRIGRKRCLKNFTTPALRRAWIHALSLQQYSHALVSYAYWGSLVESVPSTVTTVLDLHDCLTLHEMRRKGEEFTGYGRMLEDECRVLSMFDHALSISRSEHGMLESLCRDVQFHDIPIAFTHKHSALHTPEYDLLFVGSDNLFNVAGLRWFLEKVLPLVHGWPRVAVVGQVCDAVVLPPQVHALHHVANLGPVYAATRLVICPLLGGTGLKVKVIEALSHGVPVVTTRWGVDGVSAGFADCCVVADSASAFAAAIDQCLADPKRIEHMGEAARGYTNNNYSEAAVWDRLDRVFNNDSRSHN